VPSAGSDFDDTRKNEPFVRGHLKLFELGAISRGEPSPIAEYKMNYRFAIHHSSSSCWSHWQESVGTLYGPNAR
jgi:hypothetical protein